MYKVQSSDNEVTYTPLRTGEGYSSLSHTNLRLEESHHCLTSEGNDLTVDSAQTHIPITLVLKSDRTEFKSMVSVSMGSIVIGEVPLEWEDDLCDEFSCDEVVESISVLQRASTHIVVRTANVSPSVFVLLWVIEFV